MVKTLKLLVLLLIIPFSVAAQGDFIKVKTEKGYKLVIPDKVLGKDILFGSRIIDISEPSAKVYAAGQMRTPPVVVRFTKSGKILRMEQIVNFYSVDKSDPIYESIEKNQRVSAVYTFDIESKAGENSSDVSVIDVSKFFADEVSIAWPLPDNVKKGRLDPKLSSILFAKEFDDHFNIRVHYGYTGGKEPFSITVQYFMLLLPEPLKPRYDDERVGYQTISLKRYQSGRAISSEKIISRWRIEPKPEDVAKHKKGQLVEPAKPIVVYIDPAFPSEWIPFIKLGVEDWQKAFEKIGFKNAIIAKEYPKNDPNFDPEDIKINCVRYLPVDEANAAGQIWIDPRSGEILQGDVLWWNNVVSLINMWRFTQTAAVDPQARKLSFSTEMQGEMIRYAIAHETGHMLGMQHNMRSSYAYPVDSLRSPSFTKKYGTTASIMDYARNNHVAQPGDLEKGVKMTPPYLGPFDYLSLEYAYKIIYNAKDSEAEKDELNKIFTSKGKDPMYLFGPFTASPIVPDPASQSESLGNDVVKSSMYGIKNTQVILSNLKKWTDEVGGDRDVLANRYDALLKQYYRYLSLSLSYIGGEYEYQGPIGVFSERFVPVDKKRQLEALNFVMDELLTAGKYTLRQELFPILGATYADNVYKREADVVAAMLGNILLPRLAEASSFSSSNLTIDEYLDVIDAKLLNLDQVPNAFVKNIQIAYVQSLAMAYKPKKGDEIISGFNAITAESVYKRISKTKSKINSYITNGSGDTEYFKYLMSLLKTEN